MEMKNDAFITELRKEFRENNRRFVKIIWKKQPVW